MRDYSFFLDCADTRFTKYLSFLVSDLPTGGYVLVGLAILCRNDLRSRGDLGLPIESRIHSSAEAVEGGYFQGPIAIIWLPGCRVPSRVLPARRRRRYARSRHCPHSKHAMHLQPSVVFPVATSFVGDYRGTIAPLGTERLSPSSAFLGRGGRAS